MRLREPLRGTLRGAAEKQVKLAAPRTLLFPLRPAEI